MVSNFKSRILIGFLLAFIVFISYTYNLDFFLISAILFMISYDFINIKIIKNFFIFFLSICIFISFFVFPYEIFEKLFIFEVIIVFLVIYLNKYRKELFILSIFLFLLIFYYILNFDRNTFYLIILVSFINDTVAYISGRTFKGPLIVPNISPKKTWSGTLISLLITALILVYLNFNLFFSILISSFLFFGDIFFSFIKRSLNIKDFSLLLRSHGGILDRIDSMFFVVIIFQFYFSYIQ